MNKEQKAESCPEFATQDQITEAQKQETEMNKCYVQQSTNPELQTRESGRVCFYRHTF